MESQVKDLTLFMDTFAQENLVVLEKEIMRDGY